MKNYTVNIFSLISVPLTIYLGYTGKVDLWVIVLIITYGIKFNITWKR